MSYILVNAAAGYDRAIDMALELEKSLRQEFNRKVKVYMEMPCEAGHFYELKPTPFSDHQTKTKQPYLSYVYVDRALVGKFEYREIMLSMLIETEIKKGTAVIIIGGMTDVPPFFEGTYTQYLEKAVPRYLERLGERGFPVACLYDRGEAEHQEAHRQYVHRLAQLWMERPMMQITDYLPCLAQTKQINTLLSQGCNI